MEFIANIIAIMCLFALLYQGYNLILGYGGMLHVGHVAFMGVGAYVSALLTVKAGFSVLSGVTLGTLATGLLALLLAIPTVRFREDYLVAATLGMGEIIRIFILNERKLTGGSFGIVNIPRPAPFGVELASNVDMMIFLLIITTAVMLCVWRIVHTPFGRSIESIREDEIAASALGKNVWLKKVQILVLGALIAGLAGALFAHHIQFIDPSSITLDRMILVLLAVMLGGSGTFWGPIFSTILLVGLFEAMRFLPIPSHVLGPLRWIIYAAILIIIMIHKPTGLLGKKFSRKKL
ncbi:branched-chain amino acid ABC transporter permease [Candidatus Peregrinibacteria bacterium CG11_big_fil_rev_8_21_14_0_20_46_8]|nr:MAG: branched-chain amino acid ABC transporter permease [Candidatus Peregrinibacteria bacterium CG11_big_fil_rev_8_21_14_0_20_46_8]